MNVVQKRRLYFVLILTICSLVAVLLVIAALRENINLFYTPSEIKTATIHPKHRLRIGGIVQKGSVKQHNDLETFFVVTDFKQTVSVSYRGILPDLFKEGQGVVVGGYLLEPNHLKADEVLAKHDENYQPPGVNQNAA